MVGGLRVWKGVVHGRRERLWWQGGRVQSCSGRVGCQQVLITGSHAPLVHTACYQQAAAPRCNMRVAPKPHALCRVR